jgi:hypothetical protein
MRQNALVDRMQMEGGALDPVCERRAIEAKALALVDLRLAIERQMVGVLGDEHVGDRRLGRQAALQHPLQLYPLEASGCSIRPRDRR